MDQFPPPVVLARGALFRSHCGISTTRVLLINALNGGKARHEVKKLKVGCRRNRQRCRQQRVSFAVLHGL